MFIKKQSSIFVLTKTKTKTIMYTIEDIRNKKVAIHNDSTLEELKEVLRVAFPKDLCEILGVQEYYFAHRHDLHHRECSSKKPRLSQC